jgi:hypothetical protein
VETDFSFIQVKAKIADAETAGGHKRLVHRGTLPHSQLPKPSPANFIVRDITPPSSSPLCRRCAVFSRRWPHLSPGG